MVEPPSPELIAEFRTRLHARLEELRQMETLGEESRKPVELDQSAQGRLSRMDAMQQQAMSFAAQGRRVAEARLIEQALARMDTDDYGYCGTCGDPIAPGRLNLDPTLATCIACARG